VQVFTQRLLNEADQIELVNMGRDKYFRIFASIRVDGIDVARQTIEAGLAVPYDVGTKTANWCAN
jgi:endonuclease YncB( thermonuclease family)